MSNIGTEIQNPVSEDQLSTGHNLWMHYWDLANNLKIWKLISHLTK